MSLLERDEEYLAAKEYQYELLPGVETGQQGMYLLIRGFKVNAERYTVGSVDLLIHIPPGYNQARLDMFYVDPEIRIRATGDVPQAATNIETYFGRRWQRFSRHFKEPGWRPGVDCLQSMLAKIVAELQGSA